MYDPDTLAELEAVELACVLSGAKTEAWRELRIKSRKQAIEPYRFYQADEVAGLNLNHEIDVLKCLLIDNGE